MSSITIYKANDLLDVHGKYSFYQAYNIVSCDETTKTDYFNSFSKKQILTLSSSPSPSHKKIDFFSIYAYVLTRLASKEGRDQTSHPSSSVLVKLNSKTKCIYIYKNKNQQGDIQ